MKIAITYNSLKKGIECFFTPLLTEEDKLYTKLTTFGFKQAFSNPEKWYVEDKPTFRNYVESLKKAMETNSDPLAVSIQPSYQENESNILQDLFSSVYITLNTDGKTEIKNYVIFETFRGVAQDIAERYGKQKYGKRFVRAICKPREQRAEARRSYLAGKIIGRIKTTPDMSEETNLVKNNDDLKNEHGVYTKETAGESYQTISIPFPKTAKYRATIGIVRNENEQFRYGVSQHKEFGDASGSNASITDASNTYSTKEEAIREGLREIVVTIKNHIVTPDSAKENKYLQKALDTVLAFGAAYGIDLEIEDTTELESSVVSTQVLTPKYSIKQSWSHVEEKLITKFEAFVNTNLDFLRFNETESENGTKRISAAFLRSDKDEISFQLLNQSELHISAHLPLEEKVHYGGSAISKTKLKKALKYILKYPERLVAPKVEQTKIDVETRITTNSKMEVAQLPTPEFPTPPSFVFIPEGIPKPFDSGAFKISDKEWIAENFLELYKFNDNNLSTATPQELFMLMQFSHPNEYDIPVLRSTLLKHWETNGKKLFEALGYPTNSDALYANRYVDYTSISTLENLLGTKPDALHYWDVVTSKRPVTDPLAAINYIEHLRDEVLSDRLQHTNSKTQKPKSNKKDTIAYRELTWKLENYQESITLLKNTIKKKKCNIKLLPEEPTSSKKTIAVNDIPRYRSIDNAQAKRIQENFRKYYGKTPFTAQQAWEENCNPLELLNRWTIVWDSYEKSFVIPYGYKTASIKKELKDLKGIRGLHAVNRRKELKEALGAINSELYEKEVLIQDEFLLFQDELFEVILLKTKELGYNLAKDSIKDFKEELMPQLLEDRQIKLYATEPIQALLPKLLKWYFDQKKLSSNLPPPNPFDDERLSPDYMVKAVAIMSNNYMDAKRLSKGNVEKLMEETKAPNLGMLWEAVELSWLMWYKIYYSEWITFENRLGAMIRFWNKVQPTYAYSDSSKELYKQYSTPCPIGAMIAQYTQMDTAQSIFEPSAGNGLLLVGAKPEKCHVNEIDKNRRQSLLHQQFKKVTHWNAAQPFPEELTKSFDVMVTNPPFAKWEEDKFDKERIVHKYFDKHRGLEHHLRLEHLMSGLALHTLKDNGKAALIIMGHINFEEDTGYISRYRPFLNWLYRHYLVVDVINLNSYKLYNKQGATREVMLILINGRKNIPSGAAPKFKDAPHLDSIEDDFVELWQRIKSHIKTPLEKLLQQLKIINGNDIL